MLKHVLLATLWSLAEPAAAPGVEVVDRTEYYTITGTTSEALYGQMRKLGPLDPVTGKRFHAYTHLAFNWRYTPEVVGKHCRLTDISVRLETVITMPQWQPRARAERELRAGWPVFLERTLAHERGHRAIGLQGANAVRDALYQTKPRSDCKQLARDADAAAREETRRFAKLNRRYDIDTEHGIKQGIKLP